MISIPKVQTRVSSLPSCLHSLLFLGALAAGLMIGGVPVDATAQSSGDEASIKVMPIGTVHLDNPGRDVNNPKVPDVLTPQKQKELAALRDSLAQFRPTKMAIEIEAQHQSSVDSLYRAFRAGTLDTSFAVGDFNSIRSEQYQLGFRLAKRMNHERVWAVDHFIPMKFGKVMSHAKKHDPALLKYMKAYSKGPLMTTMDSLLQNESLDDLYRYLNRPETVDQFHAPYPLITAAKTDSTFVGADVVAAYHKRNLRIFANIMEAAEPGDRIITIFGAGHMPFLRPLFKASPEVEFVDPQSYL